MQNQGAAILSESNIKTLFCSFKEMVIWAGTRIFLLFRVESKYKILITTVPILRLFRMHFICDEAAKYIVLVICDGFYYYQRKRMAFQRLQQIFKLQFL